MGNDLRADELTAVVLKLHKDVSIGQWLKSDSSGDKAFIHRSHSQKRNADHTKLAWESQTTAKSNNIFAQRAMSKSRPVPR